MPDNVQPDRQIEPGDIIQIIPGARLDVCWHHVLMIVEVVKTWGVRAVVLAPDLGMNDMEAGRQHLRVPFPDFVMIGRAKFVPDDIKYSTWPNKPEPENG